MRDYDSDIRSSLPLKTLEERFKAIEKELITMQKFTENALNTLSPWVVIIDVHSKEVLFTNKTGKASFFNPETNKTIYKSEDSFLQLLKSEASMNIKENTEYHWDKFSRKLLSKGFPFIWYHHEAVVFIIYDLTKEASKLEKLRTMAYSDDLTSVFNRRYFNKAVDDLVDDNICFSLILLDIDNLKLVNDTYGHSEGDSFICTIAETIKNSLRDGDIICRTGGDEFIILLPNSNKVYSINLFESILKKLHEIKREYYLSFSYGIAFKEKNSQINVEKLLEIADEEMYTYKENIKNNV